MHPSPLLIAYSVLLLQIDEPGYSSPSGRFNPASLRQSLTHHAPRIPLGLVCLGLIFVGAGLATAVRVVAFHVSAASTGALAALAEPSCTSAPSAFRWHSDPSSNTSTPTGLDRNKVAVMIEKRNLPELHPVLLDFLAKVPQEWPFQLWTSNETAQAVVESRLLAPYVDSGKLRLEQLPDNGDTINDGHSLSAFLTAPWWWEQLAPAEHSQSSRPSCHQTRG